MSFSWNSKLSQKDSIEQTDVSITLSQTSSPSGQKSAWKT